MPIICMKCSAWLLHKKLILEDHIADRIEAYPQGFVLAPAALLIAKAVHAASSVPALCEGVLSQPSERKSLGGLLVPQPG